MSVLLHKKKRSKIMFEKKKQKIPLPVKLCYICHEYPAHPLYRDTCENCYADAQSHLTRRINDHDLYRDTLKKNGEQALDEPISILGLFIKIENCLFSNGITHIKDLVIRTREELLEIRLLGEEYVTEIEKKLQGIGLALQKSQLQKS